MGPSYVCYMRVSTREQGNSRLGLETQRSLLQAFIAGRGGTCVREFEDVSSARRLHRLSERPALQNAIALARRAKATVLVARLDRLSRSVALTALLLGSDIPFEAVDMPGASRVTLQLAAVLAEYESEMTAERTKAAMRAARDRGAVFGPSTWRFSPETRMKAAENARASHVARALEAYADIAPAAVSLRGAGRSWTEIATYLNALGHTTRSGGAWRVASVQRLVRRQSDSVHRASKLACRQFDEVVGERSSGNLQAPTVVLESDLRRDLSKTPRTVMTAPGKAIAYLRVSTVMQGAEGLSMAAQRSAVERFAERNELEVLAEYVEVGSAWRQSIDRRPVLSAALSHARAASATLVIARLDRLARDTSVVHVLLDGGVPFVCADAPWADQTTIAFLAVLAEREAQLISTRMRDVRPSVSI